jgi:hypothetical protein
MKSLISITFAVLSVALGGCASGPIAQGNATKFPEQNVKWWISGRVVPDQRPVSIHINFEGVPAFSERLSDAFSKAGYEVASSGESAEQDLSIQGVYESHGDVERTLALADVGWQSPRDQARERAIAGDAAITTALANAAVDANLIGQWWSVGMVADSVLHGTGLAGRFNNWALGKGPRYKSGWSDQTMKLTVQDRRDPRQRTVIVAGISSQQIWADQLLERALNELMRQYQVRQLPEPLTQSDLTALQEAMAATEAE